MDTITAFIIFTWLIIARKMKSEGMTIEKKGICIALTFLTCIIGLFLILLCMALVSSFWLARVIVMHLGYALVSFIVYKIFISHMVTKENAVSEDKYKVAIIVMAVIIFVLFALRTYSEYEMAQAVTFWNAMH